MLVGVAGFEPATPSFRTKGASDDALNYQEFMMMSDEVCSRSAPAKLWPPQDGKTLPRGISAYKAEYRLERSFFIDALLGFEVAGPPVNKEIGHEKI